MRRLFWLVSVLSLGHLAWAVGDQVPKSGEKNKPVGYVDCSARDSSQLTLTYLDACEKLPNVRLACGQSLIVLERRGQWLKVGLTVGGPRYILAIQVSQKPDRLVPFDVDSGIADLGPPSCSVPTEHQDRGPRATYSPDPVYPDKARKNKISGTVVLSLTVGTDGLPHDINVEKKLGYGLDEKALEAVQQWKFQPALKDGQPFEKRIEVTVSFHLY